MTSPLSPLVVRDVVRVRDGRRILDGVALSASPGQCIGLIGENGSGKTTLLRVLAGVDRPEEGEVHVPARTGLLHQEPTFAADAAVRDVMDAALAPAHELLRRVTALAVRTGQCPDDAAALRDYGDALDAAERSDAWDADRRAALVLEGVGLAGISPDRRTGTLSGGERSRLALAALLVEQPDVLLLDEPTNHLDDGALSFLEHHLRDARGVVVAASHDRVFLDAVCTHLVDLDPARTGVSRYTGAYTAYLRAKAAERARWEQAHAAHVDEVAALHRLIATTARHVAHGGAIRDNDKTNYNFHGARVESAVSARVRAARHRLDEVQRHPVPRPPEPLRFPAAAAGPPDPGDDDAPADRGAPHAPVIVVAPAAVPGRLFIERVEITSRDRLLVTGANGAGKSTLLHLLATPAARRRPGLRVGLLAQEVAFEALNRTAQAVYAEATCFSPAAPSLADLGLLTAADASRPVGRLSTGQRRRLALAVLVAAAPHVLLLDEPTNHLSLSLVEDLQAALMAAPAAVVIASHDRWLRRRWKGRTLNLGRGSATAVRSTSSAHAPVGAP